VNARPRLRKFVKWGGLAAFILLLTVWVGSAYRAIDVLTPGYSLSVCDGWCLYQLFHENEPRFGTNVTWDRILPPGLDNFPYFGRSLHSWHLDMPLWPFVAIAIGATVAAWRMDAVARRKSHRGGCTNCGYNRAGLAANASCPECNTKA